jgi:hypothetical protein
MFPPVESQVMFLSKESPIVSVGLRTAEVPYTNQNKTAWKSKSDKWWVNHFTSVQTFPGVNESFWLAKYFHPFKLRSNFLPFANVYALYVCFWKKSPFHPSQTPQTWKYERVLTGVLIGWTDLTTFPFSSKVM